MFYGSQTCRRLAVLVVGGLVMTPRVAPAQEKGLTPQQELLFKQIHWQNGPSTARLGQVATIQVPAGYQFADSASARAFSQLNGNPPSPNLLGIMQPTADEETWFVVFNYDACGYVKDDEKDKINADELLSSIRHGTEAANQERKKMGAPPLTVVGWEQPPNYDVQHNRLVWAIRGQSEGEMVINFNSRLLGREGVMSANLVVEPAGLEGAKAKYNQLLGDFSFAAGKKYAEFVPGRDKVAEYGLAALVLGGSAAVAAKSGLLGKLLKPIIAGVVLVFGAIGGFFKKLFGKRASSEPGPSGDAASPPQDNY